LGCVRASKMTCGGAGWFRFRLPTSCIRLDGRRRWSGGQTHNQRSDGYGFWKTGSAESAIGSPSRTATRGFEGTQNIALQPAYWGRAGRLSARALWATTRLPVTVDRERLWFNWWQ
jgi:hypothetical protein